jgi:hypothetical protein
MIISPLSLLTTFPTGTANNFIFNPLYIGLSPPLSLKGPGTEHITPSATKRPGTGTKKPRSPSL